MRILSNPPTATLANSAQVASGNHLPRRGRAARPPSQGSRSTTAIPNGRRPTIRPVGLSSPAKGWHSVAIHNKHIHVGGLELPTLVSPCTFARPVPFLGNWLADLRCGEMLRSDPEISLAAVADRVGLTVD